LPADEREGFASVQQVNQFKREILLMQGPIEKKDVRAVVFNDKDAGGLNGGSVFQGHSNQPAIAGRSSSFHNRPGRR
jgi:hypothetical protein